MIKPDCFYGLLALLLICSCKEESIPEVFQPSFAYEAYIHSLEQTKLLDSELGEQFVQASDAALTNPIPITTPYQEHFYFQAESPKAYGFQFEGLRGEKVSIEIKPPAVEKGRLFIDLFRLDDESNIGMTYIASATENSYQLAFEPRNTHRYLLRVQAELLHSGNYTLTIVNKSSYDFPVSGGKNHDIGSFFGDPRDGGRRKHHGIDIFARKHTPIVSPANGTVRFAGEKGLGGRVVWLRDVRYERALYFAHLESIYVETGDEVAIGDTIGTVGNTGNARTTPPHLHFGIYESGPIDPYDFVANQRPRLKEINVDDRLVGTLARVNSNLTKTIWPQDTLVKISKHQVVKIESAGYQTYRARMPNGSYISISSRHLEPLNPIETKSLTGTFFAKSDSSSIVLGRLKSPETFDILGFNQNYQLVRNNDFQGWVTTYSP